MKENCKHPLAYRHANDSRFFCPDGCGFLYDLHECKYCGAMTTQPDSTCYKAPEEQVVVIWGEPLRQKKMVCVNPKEDDPTQCDKQPCNKCTYYK